MIFHSHLRKNLASIRIDILGHILDLERIHQIRIYHPHQLHRGRKRCAHTYLVLLRFCYCSLEYTHIEVSNLYSLHKKD